MNDWRDYGIVTLSDRPPYRPAGTYRLVPMGTRWMLTETNASIIARAPRDREACLDAAWGGGKAGWRERMRSILITPRMRDPRTGTLDPAARWMLNAIR